MGGWIKWQKSLDTDPRVLKMAREFRQTYGLSVAREGRDLCNDPVTLTLPSITLVCGALVRFWSYADTHIRKDDTLDIGPLELNELVGLPGFAQSCPPDWLEIVDENTLKLPNYQEHNGVEAKRKAMTQKRVARHRHKKPEGNARVTVHTLPDQDQDQDHIKIGQQADRFSDFWNVYPIKKKKKTSHEIWKRKRLDSIADQLIQNVVTCLKSDKRWLDGFIPDPTTYLNQERWDDELQVVAAGNKPETDFEKAVRIAREKGLEPFRGAGGDPPEKPEEFIQRVFLHGDR